MSCMILKLCHVNLSSSDYGVEIVVTIGLKLTEVILCDNNNNNNNNNNNKMFYTAHFLK